MTKPEPPTVWFNEVDRHLKVTATGDSDGSLRVLEIGWQMPPATLTRGSDGGTRYSEVDAPRLRAV
jgi:hypothetical protein